MANKIIILIDGGFLRVRAKKAGKNYIPDFIEKFALRCKAADEEIFRVLYYDCAPYARKYGRKAGLQVVIMQLPAVKVARELVMHSDYLRLVTWP